MSNEFAVSALTITLRNLLSEGFNNDDFAGVGVTTKPLDKARTAETTNQLNLFLFQTEPSATWRNMDVPWRVKPGENGHPPLGLKVRYLLTGYGINSEEVLAHKVLGRAMTVLHDHPLLDGGEIENATMAELPKSNLHQQIERVRLSLLPLTLDDISKMWAGFQTQYRLSVAYEASVLLLESTRPAAKPLPVLRRGPQNQGGHVVSGLGPTLSGVFPPLPKVSAELGDTLTIQGRHLNQDGLTVTVCHPDQAAPVTLQPQPLQTGEEIRISLPAETDPGVPAAWPSGSYTLIATVIKAGQPALHSNQLSFSLAPRILSIQPPAANAGTINLTIGCKPQIRPGQQVSLIFAGSSIAPANLVTPADPDLPSELSFEIQNALPGSYVLRLRIDGVDSIPVDFSSQPPNFDPQQKVTVMP